MSDLNLPVERRCQVKGGSESPVRHVSALTPATLGVVQLLMVGELGAGDAMDSQSPAASPSYRARLTTQSLPSPSAPTISDRFSTFSAKRSCVARTRAHLTTSYRRAAHAQNQETSPAQTMQALSEVVSASQNRAPATPHPNDHQPPDALKSTIHHKRAHAAHHHNPEFTSASPTSDA